MVRMEVPVTTRHDLRVGTLLGRLVEPLLGLVDGAGVRVLGECVLRKTGGVHAADALAGDFISAELGLQARAGRRADDAALLSTLLATSILFRAGRGASRSGAHHVSHLSRPSSEDEGHVFALAILQVV